MFIITFEGGFVIVAPRQKSANKPEKKNDNRQNDLTYLETIISNAAIGMYIIQNGRFIDVSKLFQKLTGFTEAELIGGLPLDHIHHQDRGMVREQAIKFLKGERTEPYEYRFVKKNNEIMWVMETVTPIIYKDQKAVLGSFMDITERKNAESQKEEALASLHLSEEKYRTFVETIQDGYYEIDLTGRYTYVNNVICEDMQYSKEELLGRENRQYQTKEEAKKAFKIFHEVYLTGRPVKAYEMEIIRKDGTSMISETSISLIKDAKGNPVAFRGTSRDVTARKQMQEALRSSEEKYRTILETIQEGYFEVDLAGKFTFVNDAMLRLYGSSKEELLSMSYRQITDEESAKRVFQIFNNVYVTGEPVGEFNWQAIRKDGVKRYVEASASLRKDAAGNPVGFRGIVRDITERKQMEQKINYMATHDGLTGLPNRLMFSQLLSHAIQVARRHKRRLAVLFVDLDRFKIINDTMGHEAGDKLLQEIAARFKQSMRAVDIVGRLRGEDVVSRLGGDEFTILIEEVKKKDQIAAIARRILKAAIEPVIISGEECRVTASIGISIFPLDGEDEQSLMKNADAAMYFAKEDGKNNYKFFHKDLPLQSIERMSMETNMHRALENNEFSLEYQAKMDVQTGAITGVEALLRWHNANLGAITPTQFIPVAEETGLIVPIGKWVMKTACAQNVAWQRQGLPPVCVSINLSLRQLMNENLLEDIKAALDDSGMAPNLMELEITESMVMHNPARIISILTNIKKMGIRLALDDFGTGYSSLAQIKHFPIDTLKVDRSFVRNLPQDSEDKAIIEAIITMGKTLSLTVVAEGVETQEQKDFLREHVCDEMQGFYFSKPVEPAQFAELLRTHVPSIK